MSDFTDKALLSLAGIIIGAVISEITHRFRARGSLIADVAERYVPDGRAAKSPAARLGVMQRAGVSMLKAPKEIKRFVQLVTARGCADPFSGYDSDHLFVSLGQVVPFSKFPDWLRAASARGVSLTDDSAIRNFLLQCLSEAEEHEAKRTGK